MSLVPSFFIVWFCITWSLKGCNAKCHSHGWGCWNTFLNPISEIKKKKKSLNSFQKLTRRLWAGVSLCLFISTVWLRMCQRAGASSQLHPDPPSRTGKYMQFQMVLCHAWFPQGSHFGGTHPSQRKCLIISPYSRNKFSKGNYKCLDGLAAGSLYASPQTCFAHATAADIAQRAWALRRGYWTYPVRAVSTTTVIRLLTGTGI